MHRSFFLATYFADLANLETVHKPGQLITALLELSVASGVHWNDDRRLFTTHVNTNLRTISTNSKMNPAKLAVSTVQPALVMQGLHLCHRMLPRWPMRGFAPCAQRRSFPEQAWL